MIILDLQQVMLSNLMVGLGHRSHHVDIEEDLLRHMILNSIRMYRVKYRHDPNFVIACDSRNSWRKNVFPYYKANRRKNRENSDLDWNKIFTILDKIKAELKENFPYKVIEVEGAEADDIIGHLVSSQTFFWRYRKNRIGLGWDLIDSRDTVILSGDKDFVQLHRQNVTQFDPVRKRFIEHPDPKMKLVEHVLRGDAGDGVPNVLSADDCLVLGQRQGVLRQDKLDSWVNGLSENHTKPEVVERVLPLNIRANYFRNLQMIDLDYTPDDIRDKIQAEYKAQENKDRKKLMGYFMKHKLKSLMANIAEF